MVQAENKVCPETPINPLAPVDVTDLTKKIYELTSSDQKKIFNSSTEFEKNIQDVFDLNKIKTKMEQFYTILWVISQEIAKLNLERISFTRDSVQEVLLASKVFTDSSIPSQIQKIDFDVSKKDLPKLAITYNKKGVEVPLNQGKGFYLFQNGKCQHAKHLIFEQTFTFEMKRNLGNLMVTNLEGVDLFGDFGNRGIIDVDIEYVTFHSVEFLSGTQNGRVTAYVSREEFIKNKHNPLLELVTKLVPDRSVQPIDW